MHFHYNTSLTAVSLAKATNIIKEKNENKESNTKRKVFSMASMKVQYFNELLLHRFIKAFGISSKQANNNPKYQELRKIGTIST